MKISINVCFYLAIFYIADYNQFYLVCTQIKVFWTWIWIWIYIPYNSPLSVLGVSSHLFFLALGVALCPGVASSLPGVAAPGVAWPGVASQALVLGVGAALGVASPGWAKQTLVYRVQELNFPHVWQTMITPDNIKSFLYTILLSIIQLHCKSPKDAHIPRKMWCQLNYCTAISSFMTDSSIIPPKIIE